MTGKNETTKNDKEKLVENGNPAGVDLSLDGIESLRLTKKIKQAAPAYIRAHPVKGKKYYYYCQGEKEIYLGTAESILRKVKGR